MIAKFCTPSEQTLQEKPHLKSYLEELEELRRQFFENRTEEDKQKVQLYGVGRLAPQMIPMVKSVFVSLKIRRRRNRWQQYLHNSRKKGLHFRRPDDYKKIRRTYKDLIDKKALELIELGKETQAFTALFFRYLNQRRERISYGALECLQDLKINSFESVDCKKSDAKSKMKAYLRKYILRQNKKNVKIIHITTREIWYQKRKLN
ncbi:hypothetical protein EDC96DRAFT_596276 [Choanephora cucurbitarum]|nr:hypothetical protein EDC96DRAFT_596276 [Choanephora cucurbitarum]